RTWGRKAAFPTTVIIDANPFDYGINTVTCLFCLGKPLQQYNTCTVTENSTLGIGIERAAMPVITEHRTFLIDMSTVNRRFDRHATRQCHVALPVVKPVHSLGNSKQ